MTSNERAKRALARMEELLNHKNMPRVILAHYFIQCLLPRMMIELGVEECASELARQQATALCNHTGTCIVCQKVPATTNENLCVACQAQADQFEKEMDDAEAALGDDDFDLPEDDD